MHNFELTNSFLKNIFLNFDFLKNILPENYEIYIDFLPIFVISFVFSFFGTPLIGYIATKLKILDDPCQLRKGKCNPSDDPKRHIHKKPIPLLGGLAFIIPVVVTLYLLFDIAPEIQAIMFGSLILIVVGILDDTVNLPSIYQLIGQIIAGIVICLSPITLISLNLPFLGTLGLDWMTISLGNIGNIIFPGDIIMLIWILVCINAIKFVAGSDGLMESNAIIICLLFFVLGVRTGGEMMVILSLVLAGSLTGFLYYNFPPAKIFSGSAGKTTLGFLIAVIAILNQTKFIASILILTLPMIDFFFVIIKRYVTHRPKSIMQLIKINDMNHLHHQLINLGLTPKKILFLETSITLVIGLIVVLMLDAMNLFYFFLVMLMGLITIYLLHSLVNKRKREPEKIPEKTEKESPESKYSY